MRMPGETGFSLLETIVALALLGIIGVAFLSALATTSDSRLIADEHLSARILAESQMEDIKKQPFLSSYGVSESLLAEYPGYSVTPTVYVLGNGIQKIVITVNHHSKNVHVLEGYKVDR
jgi:prepilin-type N-terminal cleavage/methylation domain-containing protein